jgi:hypothetical protein
MISGIAQYTTHHIVLAYIPPDTFDNEATDNPQEQRRKAANRPELRLVSQGEELSADALSLANFHQYGCNDYDLVRSQRPGEDAFFVISPSDIIIARPRDEVDHIDWLVERNRFQEALEAADRLQEKHGNAMDVRSIGLRYMQHLLDKNDYSQAAALAPRVLGTNVLAWEEWITRFIAMGRLQVRVLPSPLNPRTCWLSYRHAALNSHLRPTRPFSVTYS